MQSEANAISPTAPFDSQQSSTSGTDIYVQLDKYFAEAAREISLGAPLDDIALIQYILPSFNRFHAGAQSSNRLLSYVNRHYVKRAVDEDRGWLRLTDVLESVAKSVASDDSREIVSRKFREKRLEELKKWGYQPGDSTEKVVFAESCAEAASPPDRIIPVLSLAHRRFRLEFIEPLLAVPKVTGKNNSKVKNKVPKTPLSANPARPKGRLARAVKTVLESDTIDEEERFRLASGLANTLQIVGIREDHSLRKRLDKYVASVPLVTPSPPP